MEDMILQEVQHDVFDQPKSTIDLDYLYSVQRQIQDFADEANSQLKKNVYQNYSLFIESSREISTLKDEMRQLNVLLEQQQSALTKLLEQFNKTPSSQPSKDPPKINTSRLDSQDAPSEEEAEMLPSWLVKSPEDFDVLIAQRNLREAVELAQKIKEHLSTSVYTKSFDDKSDLKQKIDMRLNELVSAISSELHPTTDKTIQGGPRSSVTSIQLLRELNLSSRAVKLYLDQRSSVLSFILGQQRVESTTTLQFIKQICSIFFHHIIETCKEYKQAFELDKYVNLAIDECAEIGIRDYRSDPNKVLLFDLVEPIYHSRHPQTNDGIGQDISNGNDILSYHLNNHHANKIADNSLVPNGRNALYNLSTCACLFSWIIKEFVKFIALFRKHIFNDAQLSISMLAESIYHLKNQCSKIIAFCEIDMCRFIEKELEQDIQRIIEDSENKLVELVNKLSKEEQWQPQKFINKAQMTRFFEELNDVDLKTIPNYIVDDLKLPFTACKTTFARYFLITVSDLSKLVTPANKDKIDTVLAKAFDLEMQHVVDSLKKVKVASAKRFIMGNSNFLLDKVIPVADAQYSATTNSKCQKLVNLRSEYQAKVKAEAKM